jgi:hypothetical protein
VSPAVVHIRDKRSINEWRKHMARQEKKRTCEWCGSTFTKESKLARHEAKCEKRESRFVWRDGEIAFKKEER